MKITVCIGSACHLKGSKQVIEQLQKLVDEHHLSEQVSLGGKFCMGHCAQGVSVAIGEEIYSVQPDNVQEFFQNEVLSKLQS